MFVWYTSTTQFYIYRFPCLLEVLSLYTSNRYCIYILVVRGIAEISASLLNEYRSNVSNASLTVAKSLFASTNLQHLACFHLVYSTEVVR